MEAVKWVCGDALEDHYCTISCQEAKVLESEQCSRPRTVQWSMVWFSAPITPQPEVLELWSDPGEM